MEVAVAPDGNIWFAEVLEGRPGRLDPKTGAIQEYAVPIMAGAQSEKGIYGLAIDRRGAIWFTDIGDNAIGRFQPQRGQFTFYPIPTSPSTPFGLTIDQAGNVWFTEVDLSANAIGLLPGAAAP